MSDLISRQAAIDCVCYDQEYTIECLEKLPSAQPEPAIPLSWIEGRIEWLKSLDNEFSLMAVGTISALVNMWKNEQKEGD